MGLFGSKGFSLYDQGQGGVQAPQPMPSQLNPVQGLTPDMMPKRPGLFGGWNTPGEDGSTRWDKIGMVGATMRDDPSVLANAQQAMQRQQQIATASHATKQKEAEAQQRAAAIAAHVAQSNDPKLQQVYAVGGPEAAAQYLQATLSREPPRPQAINLGDGGVAEYDPAKAGALNILRPPEAPKPATPVGMVRDETGNLHWAPGYVEAQAALTGARRSEVVSHPMPSRARAAAAHSPASAATGKAPWERTW